MLHGVAYGPFGSEEGDGLPGRERAAEDLRMIAAWGGKVVRVYTVPPGWFLDLCGGHGLVVLAGVPWAVHADFLSGEAEREMAKTAVREAARALAGREEVAALLVGNEIPSVLVRWLGWRRVRAFLEELIDVVREEAPELLAGYANYPSTEVLVPGNADFVACNVYLEDGEALGRYLARLQNLAGDRPLLISEVGADVLGMGEERQAALLRETVERCREAGVAGQVVFAFTDEWHRGGGQVEGWRFGLTDAARRERLAWRELAGGWPGEVVPAGGAVPRVSVVVCTRNGVRTLGECLGGLARVRYGDYEVIVVDDGSAGGIAEICEGFAGVRYVRQEAAGLGVARNTGAAAATGEIIAYTDDDCVPDEDWLNFLVRAFADPAVGAAGGPNIPPAAVNAVQASVIAAPGGPAHVLTGDREAEHLPGCNLAVRREAFAAVGGFRAEYHAAGDDVDFCWRLLEAGWRLEYVAAAMVWHYRRFTARAYLRQQWGYGKAEALLMRGHGERFGLSGGARWRGAVYEPAAGRLGESGVMVYGGTFGMAGYQIVYRRLVPGWAWLVMTVPWWLVVCGLMMAGFRRVEMAVLGLVMAAVPVVMGWWMARGLRMGVKWDGDAGARWRLWGLVVVQPVVRSAARLWWGLRLGSWPGGRRGEWRWPSGDWKWRVRGVRGVVREYWSAGGVGREALLSVLEGSGKVRVGDEWDDWDLRWQDEGGWEVRVSTVTEYHREGARTKVRMGVVAVLGWLEVWFAGVVVSAVVMVLRGTMSVPNVIPLAMWGWVIWDWRQRGVRRRAVAVADVERAAAAAGLVAVPANAEG